MDIIVPEIDPAEVYPQVRIRFLAEARDEKGNDVSDRAIFSWTFPDAEDSTVGNPVLHRFPELGKSLVSVTATLDSDSGCAETTVIVIPYEGGGLRQVPEVDDFTFTANGHESGAEVADHVGLLVEQVGDTYPFFWVGTEFQRYQNGQWVAPEFQTGEPYYSWFTTDDYPQCNGPVQWRARVMLDDIGAFPPNGMDLYLPGTWTVVNTVVKSASPPLIIHHAEDTSHTIAWDLTHCEDFDPLFTMTVTIHDLAGNTVATLVRYDVPLEEENPQIVWDTNLPEEDGIYTYRICARHEHDTPLITCVDWDKSGALVLTLNKFYYFDKDVQAGTLKGVVKYTLNRLAADTVTIRFYDPDLDEYSGSALTGQDNTAGTHWSDVYTLTGVEFDENDEPVGPISCVLFADESATDAANNRDGEPKPALQKGSTNLVRVLEILEPNENPVTDNNFVFDNTADPNGTCEVVATGTTHQGLDDDDLEWDLDEITGSTLSSDPDPPEGPEITFTYTRLPASNSEFGNHTLTLSHPDVPCKDYQTVQIFFPRDATNHPDPGTGATPNWFYYWAHTSACYGSPLYNPNYTLGVTYWFNGQWQAFLGTGNAGQYNTPHEGDNANDTLDGIDHYAWVCRHEGKHAADFTLWWPNGRPDPAQPDTDNDFLPDNDEANLGGTQQNPRNGGPFYVGPTDDSDGDGMRDIEDYTVNTQPPWTKGSADGEDWPSPGKQSDL